MSRTCSITIITTIGTVTGTIGIAGRSSWSVPTDGTSGDLDGPPVISGGPGPGVETGEMPAMPLGIPRIVGTARIPLIVMWRADDVCAGRFGAGVMRIGVGDDRADAG